MSISALRLAFAGTPALAEMILQALIETDKYEISVIFTQPDSRAGRGRKQSLSPVKQLAELHHLKIRQPISFSLIDPENELSDTDILIVAAYGMILPKSILNKPRLGCINVHTSLLPRWRGAAPIQRAIEAGDETTGITIMQMDEGLDTGDILLQRSCPILAEDTAGSMHDKLATLGAECLLETLQAIENGTITPQAQDNRQANYASKITKQEAQIDWNKSAKEIQQKIMAFNPAPVAFTELNGLQLRIWNAHALDIYSRDLQPGNIAGCSNEGIDVVSGENILRITQLQLPGKNKVAARDFLNGHPDFIKAMV